ncbi:MAG: hypothetical protein K6T81_09245 [Alicyclobacillus macrosporangiidus]|uniref:hypothetical protein n=1 Tax=Alicyclobacillus macrosporangiidus TaxID=392015 RepID=UPI0026F1163D|nr:hypothetical protein [Alicyclobacillus macrosporangiidus]MCL6598915.1 hypothetical protein [Alicyclobacillus macrosporangiidus]
MKAKVVVGSAVGVLLMLAPATIMASPKTGSSTSATIDTYIHGEHVVWTPADQKKADQRRAELGIMPDGTIRPASVSSSRVSSSTVIPNAGLTPPPTNDSEIGTGLWSNNDFLQDSSESKTGSDSYLILEAASANTCGPIAAHNLLTHFGRALNWYQLGPEVGYDGTQTGWSSQYANGLNQNESSYPYTAYGNGFSSSKSAWTLAWDEQVSANGVMGVPVAQDTYGQLPGFNHAVAHWWVGFGYAGNDNNGLDNPSNQYIHYFDSSEEHPGTYWFNQPMTSFIGIVETYGTVG